MPIPHGFELSPRTGPFVDLIGPLYQRRDERGIVLGLFASEKHCNARQRVHGAVLCAILDLALGRNAARAADASTQPVTAALNVQFLAPAAQDDWLEATAQVLRSGRRLAFVEGAVHAGDRRVASASAVFTQVPTA